METLYLAAFDYISIAETPSTEGLYSKRQPRVLMACNQHLSNDVFPTAHFNSPPSARLFLLHGSLAT